MDRISPSLRFLNAVRWISHITAIKTGRAIALKEIYAVKSSFNSDTTALDIPQVGHSMPISSLTGQEISKYSVTATKSAITAKHIICFKTIFKV